MIELAARALYRRRVEGRHPKPDNYPWEALTRREQALLRADAYAVLNAIREPSDAMQKAGMSATGGDGSVLAGYEAMVDAMLDEANRWEFANGDD